MKSYRDLEVYRLSFSLAGALHKATLSLPAYEKYELGSQTRRSAQSIRANIVEGYGRSRYKRDFIHFLVQAHGSCLETLSHLEMLVELYPDLNLSGFITKYDSLGAQIYRFIQYVENNWRT